MMHAIFKKLTSLVLVAFMVLSMVPIVAVSANAAEGDQTYTKVDLADIQSTDTVIIVSTKGTASYAMSNDNGTTAAPTAVLVSISGDTATTAATNIQWNIDYNSDSKELTIYPDGTTATWLYCTATNNGVRVGTNSKKTFTLDTSGYLKFITSKDTRYLGVYNNADWRCYTNTTGNTAGQTFSFYKQVGSECEHTWEETSRTDATCTVDGSVEYECSVCHETKTETLIAEGHNFVDGECTVCHAKQPKTLTINRGSFSTKQSGYDWLSWTATATTGETIPGKGYIFNPDNQTCIQMRDGKYIYNTGELPGGITSITLTAEKATFRDFYVVTSDTPFDHTDTNKQPNIENATSKNVTTSGATWEFNTADRYFAIVVKNSGTAYLSSIEITYEGCSHANFEEKAEVPATCTEDGRAAGKFCNDCNTYFEGGAVIPALGHDWSEWEVTTAPGCETAGEETRSCARCDETETQPVEKLGHNWLGWVVSKDPTCTETGEQTGTCSRCGETKTVEIPVIDHAYNEDGICINCGAIKTETTNRYYIATIRTTGNYFYMTTDLGQYTPHYMAEDSQLTTLPDMITAPEEDKVFVLVENSDGTYSIYAEGLTGNNYLGYNSSDGTNSGAFVTEEDAKHLTKKINGDNTCSFYFNDGLNDRYLSLNENTGSDFFAWYASTQKRDLALIPVEGEAVTPAEKNPIVGRSITLQDDLKVNFYLDIACLDAIENEQVYIKVGSTEASYKTSDFVKKEIDGVEYYVATVSMAAAQMMDKINVQVIDLDSKLLENKNYTIREYADAILGDIDQSKYHALVKEMLNYGGMAQKFFNYNTGNPANAGITGVGATPVPESAGSDMNKTNDSDGCITFYGASLVYRDKIAVRYYFDVTNAEGLKFTADGNECDAVQTGGHYVIEVPDICPQDYDTQIRVIVTNAEGHSATVSYGPMNYIVRMYKKASDAGRQDIMDLLQALYNYHLAAVAYIAAQNA